MWGSAGLKMPIHAHFFGGQFWSAKVGQTVRDQASLLITIISRSVRARLQVYVCHGYDLCHPGCHFDPRDLKNRSNQK